MKILERPPEIPVHLSLDKIRTVFDEPCLFEVPGIGNETLFISTLLHGNEATSFEVLKRLLLEFKNKPPKKNLLFLVGNVAAAELNKRFMNGQQDYNRIWKGGSSLEHQWAKQVKDFVAERAPLFATIDIHNNTGKNPFYACISELEDPFVYLASLFSPTLVYFKNPDTVLSNHFSQLGPSLTLECGATGNLEGVDRAFQFIVDVDHLDSLQHRVKGSDVHIFETVGRVVVNPEIKVAFGKDLGDVNFSDQVESMNFCEQLKGTLFCRTSSEQVPFQILDQQNQNLFDKYCYKNQQDIFWRRPVIPSMFTRDTKVIGQDCLGYIMEPVSR